MKAFVLAQVRASALLFFVGLVVAVPSALSQTATLSPTSSSFGSVGIGGSAAKTFTLKNTGTAALSVTSISASGSFSSSTTCGAIAAKGSCSISVSFTPTATGSMTGTLTVVDSAGTQTSSLTGTGAAPATISPASRSFGNVAVGSPSAAKTFTVANKSTSTMAFTVTPSAGFVETDNCASVAANASCTINASAEPTAAGAETGTISVSYSGFGSPLSASVTATGIAPVTISPASRAFGNVAAGTTSAAKTFTVTNKSTSTIAFTVTPSTGFVETDNCASVAANATCTINASYAPTAVGAQTGTISVSYGGFGSPLSVSVTGTGIAPVTVSPATLAFSTTLKVGTASNSKTVTINNKATVALTIQSIVASPAAYTETNTCGTSIAASSSCTVTVIFTPNVSGSIPGTLTITDGAVGSPQVVTMTGAGVLTNLKSIAITPANSSVAKGAQMQFTATGTYSNGTTGNVTAAAVWTSTNPAVLSIVSNTGLATGVSSGATTVSASVAGTTTVSNSTGITVSGAALASIALSPVGASIAPGGTQQYTAMGTYTDSSTAALAASSLVFSSDNTGVATVSATGMATGVNGGTANIKASSGTMTSPSVPLTVTGPTLQSITISPSAPSITKGGTQQFTATGNYSDGTHPDLTTQVTWSATPTSNLTISNTAGTQGLATAVAAGPATVTASWGGGTVQGTDSVTVAPPALTAITVTPASVNLGQGALQQYTATGTYADGTTANITSQVTWISGNTSLVSITNAGLATVLGTSSTAISISASLGTVTSNPPAFLSALSSLPLVCPQSTIDMKVLVVTNNAAAYVDLAAIQQILDYIGTPYTVMDISTVTPTVLSDGACHGYYQGVIMAFGDDIYNSTTLYSTLNTYETTFQVRQVNWFFNPTPDYGFNDATSTVASTTTYTANFTPAAATVFPNINTATPLTISGAFIYLSQPYTPASPATVTPLLTDASGNVLSEIYAPGNGQQILSQTFDSNQYLTHDLVLAYGLINWVTKGIFLGDYHVYASPQVDDFFIDDSEWIPSTPCLTNLATKDRTAPDASNLPVFRLNSADMTQLVTWQNGVENDPSGLFSQFKLTLALNGVGTAGNGDWTGLTAPVIATSSTNGVASFVAQSFSGLVGQKATVTGTTNGNGIFNGTWTITGITSSAATTPGTTTFTATISAAGTIAQKTENAGSVSVPDDLVANLQTYQSNFHWISHTYDHPGTLNGLCQSTPTGTGCGDVEDGSDPTDDIDLEILTNRWVASDPNALPAWGALDLDSSDAGLKQLTFTDFNSGNIVTPGVTGLNDPNVPTYLYNDGIRYAVSDTSVIGQANNGPNPSPNVGIVNVIPGTTTPSGIYEVPRYPNDVFYNAANWADDEAEFVCIYSNYVEPGSTATPAPDPPFNTYNAAQILDFTSTTFVANMLKGDMDPQMFHQPDLHFSDNYPALSAQPFGPPSPAVTIPGLASPHVSSLISDTYNLTFTKYKALYNLPVLSPTLDQLGQAMQNRNAYNESGVTASMIGVGGSTPTISITMPSGAAVSSAVIPVSGLNSNGAELYGGKNISHITLTSGQTITLPLQ